MDKSSKCCEEKARKKEKPAKTKPEIYFPKRCPCDPVETVVKQEKMKIEHPIKPTTTTILREAANVMKEENCRILNLLSTSEGLLSYSNLLDELQKEKEKQELLEVEKKHLKGQLSYEEAIIARKRVVDENILKRQQFEQERMKSEEEYERWRYEQQMKNKEAVEAVQTFRETAREKKRETWLNKLETAHLLAEERQARLKEKFERDREELERKIKLIKEYKIIQAIRKLQMAQQETYSEKLKELSTQEIQSKLKLLKIKFKNELLKKQEKIRKTNIARGQLKNTAKDFIVAARNMQKDFKEQRKSEGKVLIKPTNPEILSLQEKLERARNSRLQRIQTLSISYK